MGGKVAIIVTVHIKHILWRSSSSPCTSNAVKSSSCKTQGRTVRHLNCQAVLFDTSAQICTYMYNKLLYVTCLGWSFQKFFCYSVATCFQHPWKSAMKGSKQILQKVNKPEKPVMSSLFSVPSTVQRTLSFENIFVGLSTALAYTLYRSLNNFILIYSVWHACNFHWYLVPEQVCNPSVGFVSPSLPSESVWTQKCKNN